LQSQNLDGKEVWLRFPGTGEFSYRGLDPSDRKDAADQDMHVSKAWTKVAGAITPVGGLGLTEVLETA